MLKAKAKPYDYHWEPEQSALMLIDFQRDFLDKGGFGESLGNDVSKLRKTVEPTKKILDELRRRKLLIIHTREGHLPDLSDCPESKLNRGNFKTRIGDKGPMGRILIRGEYGHDIVDELKPIQGEIVIDKPGKGSFYNTNLNEILKSKKIKYLIFTGVTTEVCVASTLREANDRGYEPLILSDCVSSYHEKLHKAALKMITSQDGVLGWVTTSKKFLKSMHHPQFFKIYAHCPHNITFNLRR